MTKGFGMTGLTAITRREDRCEIPTEDLPDPRRRLQMLIYDFFAPRYTANQVFSFVRRNVTESRFDVKSLKVVRLSIPIDSLDAAPRSRNNFERSLTVQVEESVGAFDSSVE